MKVLLVVIVFAIVVYLAVRWLQDHGTSGPGGGTRRPSGPRRPSPPPRPMGPDDDPDFLRDLDRRRKRHDPPQT